MQAGSWGGESALPKLLLLVGPSQRAALGPTYYTEVTEKTPQYNYMGLSDSASFLPSVPLLPTSTANISHPCYQQSGGKKQKQKTKTKVTNRSIHFLVKIYLLFADISMYWPAVWWVGKKVPMKKISNQKKRKKKTDRCSPIQVLGGMLRHVLDISLARDCIHLHLSSCI